MGRPQRAITRDIRARRPERATREQPVLGCLGDVMTWGQSPSGPCRSAQSSRPGPADRGARGTPDLVQPRRTEG